MAIDSSSAFDDIIDKAFNFQAQKRKEHARDTEIATW